MVTMDYESQSAFWPPDCWCENGKMGFRQAGTIKNPGRYFYACPRNLVHPHSFMWCDVYHHNDPPHAKPHFLRYPKPMQNPSNARSGPTSLPNCNPSSQQSCSSSYFLNCNPSLEGSQVLGTQSDVKLTVTPETNGFVHHITCAISSHQFYLGCVILAIWSILIVVMSYYVGRYSQ